MFKEVEMKLKMSIVLGLLVVFISGCASGPTPQEGWYPKLTRFDEVSQHAVLPKEQGAMIVDSRHAARKYNKGHIPTAVNIPERLFDKLTDKLPADKSAL